MLGMCVEGEQITMSVDEWILFLFRSIYPTAGKLTVAAAETSNAAAG